MTLGTFGKAVHVLAEGTSLCGRSRFPWAWEVSDYVPKEAIPTPLCKRCEKVAFPVRDAMPDGET